MKIFNEENGVSKVYVQLNDLAYLIHNEGTIPASLMRDVFGDVFIVTDDNRFEFREFTDPSVVEYFKKIDWIPDYKVVRKYSEQELLDLAQELSGERLEIVEQIHNLKPNEEEKHEQLLSRLELLGFKLRSLAEILWVKKGFKTMPFPIVPDSDGFSLSSDNKTQEYIVKQGINPLQYLLYRVDGQPFDKKKDNNIPQGLIASADGLCISSNTESNEFFGDFELTRKLSDDKMYLVTTFNMIVPNEENTLAPDHPSITLRKKVKDKISRFFKRTN